MQELSLAAGRHDHQAVGLLQVGGQLGQELVRSDADRDRQAFPRPDLAFDLAGDGNAVPEQAGRCGDVQKGLVDAERLDELGVRLEDLHDALGYFGVKTSARAQIDGVRAAAVRLGDRHRRPDAELSGRVVTCRHDTASRPATRVGADDDGTIGDLRVLARLDGGEERVHVSV